MMNSLELEKDNIIKGVKNLLRFKKQMTLQLKV